MLVHEAFNATFFALSLCCPLSCLASIMIYTVEKNNALFAVVRAMHLHFVYRGLSLRRTVQVILLILIPATGQSNGNQKRCTPYRTWSHWVYRSGAHERGEDQDSAK